MDLHTVKQKLYRPGDSELDFLSYSLKYWPKKIENNVPIDNIDVLGEEIDPLMDVQRATERLNNLYDIYFD